MKLLNCLTCNDIVTLHYTIRKCLCGKAFGRYLADGIVAEIGGTARVIGINNRHLSGALVSTIPGDLSPEYPWFVIPEHSNRVRRLY